MRTLFIVLILFFVSTLRAQPSLKGSIGLDAMPDDGAAICTGPIYNITGPWDLNAYPEFPFDTIPDFTLYTIDSLPVTASKLLSANKPLVVIAGSYTCDVFREMIPQINQIYTRYGDSISLYIIYTLEAHPIIDPNFYRGGQNWVVLNDSIDNVLYRQPTTYGARKALVDTMLRRQTSPSIKPPIVLDGPCNEWWRAFGPAPNCAYLIDRMGHVVKHQAWFNVHWNAIQKSLQPEFLANYIDTLLHPLKASVPATSHIGISVWPNSIPRGGSIHVQSSTSALFTLSDVLGRPVLTERVGDDGSVPLARTAPGAYYYRLDQDGSVTTGRLIVSP